MIENFHFFVAPSLEICKKLDIGPIYAISLCGELSWTFGLHLAEKINGVVVAALYMMLPPLETTCCMLATVTCMVIVS